MEMQDTVNCILNIRNKEYKCTMNFNEIIDVFYGWRLNIQFVDVNTNKTD